MAACTVGIASGVRTRYGFFPTPLTIGAASRLLAGIRFAWHVIGLCDRSRIDPASPPAFNYIVAAIVSRSSHRRATHLHGESIPYPPNLGHRIRWNLSMISAGFPTDKNSLHYCAPIVNTVFCTITQGKGRGGRLCRSQLIGNVGKCRFADHNWRRMIGNVGARVRLCNVRGV